MPAGSVALLMVAALLPCMSALLSIEDEAFLRELDSVKVFVYDLEGAGLMPPLSSLGSASPICQDPHCASIRRKLDLCNFGLGHALANDSITSFAYQNLRWTNTRTGQDLGITIHHRILNSKHLTMDPEQADILFIPIFAPQTCQDVEWYNMASCGVDFMEYTNWQRLWTWMLEQPSFKSSDGADHVMVLARPWTITNTCPAVLGSEVAKGAKHGLPETWPVLVRNVRTRMGNIKKLVVDRNVLAPNVFPVPYSAAFHFLPAAPPPSLSHVRALHGTAGLEGWRPERLLAHRRPMLACHIGAFRKHKDSYFWALKDHVRATCIRDADCTFVSVSIKQSGEDDMSVLRQVAGIDAAAAAAGFPSLDALVATATVHHEAVYFLSTFCLTPGGDTPTRKGLFDALIMGCIPVIFYPQTAEYPWHLPVADLSSFAIYIPPNAALASDSYIMDTLRAVPQEEVERKRAVIVRLASRLQYAAGALSEEEHAALGPDAVDLILGNLAREVRAHRHAMETGSGKASMKGHW